MDRSLLVLSESLPGEALLLRLIHSEHLIMVHIAFFDIAHLLILTRVPLTCILNNYEILDLLDLID